MCLFQFWFPQCVCPAVGLLGHKAVLFPVFKGISTLFSIVAILVCIPTNSEIMQIKTTMRYPFMPLEWPLQYSCLANPMDGGAWRAAVHGVARSQTQLSDFTFTFHFPELEKDRATHSIVLAWRIPRMGEPGGLPSMRSHRVRHDWSDLAAAAAAAVGATGLEKFTFPSNSKEG